MKIYNAGIEYLDIKVDDSSYRYRELCGDEYVQLEFESAEHISIPDRAYIVVGDTRYTLIDAPKITSMHSRSYSYVARFEGPSSLLKLYRFRNHIDGRQSFSFTGTPREHLTLLIKVLGIFSKNWGVGTCISADSRNITYNNLTCREALEVIAKEFNTEWEIIGFDISLHKVEYGQDNPIALAYGKDKGFLPGISRNTLDGDRAITTLYPQGSQRNIDPSKYNSSTLHLPNNGEIMYDGTHFEGELGFNATQAKTYRASDDGSALYSGLIHPDFASEGTLDCTEIYPHREGEVSQVLKRDDEQSLYDVVDSDIPSTLNYEDYRIAGENMVIVFQSGMLAGREFVVSRYVHNAGTLPGRRFELVPQSYDGITMPSDNYIPAAGDKYSIFGIAMPDAYIADDTTKTGAAWDMMRKCVKHLYEASKAQYHFKGRIDSKYVKKHSIQSKMRPGGHISFSNDSFQPEAVILRITNVKDYINAPNNIDIELGEKPARPTTKLASILSNSRNQQKLLLVATNNQRDVLVVQRSALSAQTTANKASEGLSANEKALFAIETRLTNVENNTSSTDISALKTKVDDNSNLLKGHSTQLLTLQTTQGELTTTIKNQGTLLLTIDMSVKSIDERVTNVENKARVVVVTPDNDNN